MAVDEPADCVLNSRSEIVWSTAIAWAYQNHYPEIFASNWQTRFLHRDGKKQEKNQVIPHSLMREFLTMSNPTKNVQAGTAYIYYWIDRQHGDVQSGLNRYGTGPGYADNIIQAAEVLKRHPQDSHAILEAIHP